VCGVLAFCAMSFIVSGVRQTADVLYSSPECIARRWHYCDAVSLRLNGHHILRHAFYNIFLWMSGFRTHPLPESESIFVTTQLKSKTGLSIPTVTCSAVLQMREIGLLAIASPCEQVYAQADVVLLDSYQFSKSLTTAAAEKT